MGRQLVSGFNLLSEPIRSGLEELGLDSPTGIQTEAFEPILQGHHVLLIAPTGTGKTEAAVLPVLDMLLRIEDRKGISLLYITPLRALNRDMLRRLRFWTDHLGLRLDVRHGDTPQTQRRRQSSYPPDILVTTPETLQAMLPSKAMRRHLRSVRWVIVDEIHNLAMSKRGTQLAVALERLREATDMDFQRIGLSATVGSPQTIANFLGGVGREVLILQASTPKEYEYDVIWPTPGDEDRIASERLYTSPEAAARILLMRKMVDSHKSTLIFVNSRQHAEMLGLRFNMLGKDIAVHHGSLSKEERQRVEEEFKKGALKAIVCTSTLELGIDVGSVDQVIQYLSPRQVTSLMQRVGRSGHRIGRKSTGSIVCASTDDFAESVAAVTAAKNGFMEQLDIHENALDVLAHQCAGLVMDLGKIKFDTILKIFRRTYPFRNISSESLSAVLKYLGSMGKLRIEENQASSMPATRLYYYQNISTIPDERRYPIIDVSNESFVGTLGDEFVSTKARVGLKFICRGMAWRIEQISLEGKVFVTPASDPTAAIPGWEGELLPISYELAIRTGELRREIATLLESGSTTDATHLLSQKLSVDPNGIKAVVDEIANQISTCSILPSDKLILAEGFGPYLIVNCCFGELVNRAITFAFKEILHKNGLDATVWNDGYRILLGFSFFLSKKDVDRITWAVFSLGPEEAEDAAMRYIATGTPISYYLKFVAERFGAIPRGLMLNEEDLSELSFRFAGTPIFEETVREALVEKIDLENMKKVFEKVRAGEISVRTLYSPDSPTPISRHILSKFIEIPELIAPRTVEWDSVKRLKEKTLSSHVHMLCMNCGATMYKSRLRDLPDDPVCIKCSARLIYVSSHIDDDLKKIVAKHLRKSNLSKREKEILMDAGLNADLVLTHGKRAATALLVFGVGPHVAARILRKPISSEDEFFKELLEAKLNFIRTRPFWPSSG